MKTQELQSLCLKDYEIRIIVAGSRNWKNKRLFFDTLVDYIEVFDKPIIFISGGAKTGADDFIVKWCKRYKFPCKVMNADWDAHGKAAGMLRNIEMAKVGTNLLLYWDGRTPGSKQMLKVAQERHLKIKTFIVELET